MDLESNKRAIDNLVGQAIAQFEKNDYLASAISLQSAADAAWHSHAGMFFSSKIESLLVELSTRIAPECSVRSKRAAGPECVLHVLTQAYNIGGHTRLVWRWIEKDSARQHSIVLTQHGEMPLPHQLRTAASNSGGRLICFDPSKNLLALALELREMGGQFDYIVLHQHPFDVVPLLAWGSAMDHPPIIHFNHADHVFWIGASLCDINAEFRLSGQRISLTRRGFAKGRTLQLPLPLPENFNRSRSKAEAKAQLGIPVDHFLALTVASEHKFHAINAMDFGTLHSPLLERCDKLRFLIVGPSPSSEYWKKLHISSNRRVKAVGLQADTSVYLEAADIYLDSTPIGSLTSMLEAGLAGIPCVSWRPYEPGHPAAVLACDDAAFENLPVIFNEYGPYLDHIEACLGDASLAANISTSLQKSIIEKHSGAAWREALESVYRSAKSQALARPHRLDETLIGEPAVYDEILLRTQSGFFDFVPSRHGKSNLIGRFRGYLAKRRSKLKRSIIKRLIRLAERKNMERLPFRSFTPPQMHLDLALSLVRLSEVSGRTGYRDVAYQLITGVDLRSLGDLPLSDLEKILSCLVAEGDRDRIAAIASDLSRGSPILPPVWQGLAVASAFVEVDADAEADKLFAGWRDVTPKLFGHRHLSGVFKVRTLFSEHLGRSDAPGLCRFKLPSINGVPRSHEVILPLPYDDCVVLENAAVAGFETIVDDAGRIAVYDLAGHPRFPHVAGHAGLLKGTRQRPDRAVLHYPFERVIELPSAVHLAGRSAGNYFHWLVEYLPRLLNAIEGKADKDAPILIPENLPNSMMRALAIVNAGRFPTQVVPKGAALEVERLFVPSMHTFIVDAMAMPLRAIGAMSGRHLQFVRQKVLSTVSSVPASRFPRKIFLCRGSRPRSITNEAEIQESLMQDGFIAIDTATMTFEDQVCLFRNAEIIVGASSAAFANLLFCERNPVVLSLISAHLSDFDIYSNLLEVACGGTFSHVLGMPIGSPMAAADNHQYMHVNYSVNVGDVHATLRAMSGVTERTGISYTV